MWKAIKEYYRWKVDLRSGIKISEILQQTVRMSEKLCLQWNDFKENVNSAFGRLRDDKEFTDVTLACDDGQMEAHKVILAASSPSTSTDLLERVNIQLCCKPTVSFHFEWNEILHNCVHIVQRTFVIILYTISYFFVVHHRFAIF